MNSFTSIEIVILCRVNQIEARDPAKDSRPQNDWRKIDMFCLGNPRADRGEGEGEAEEEVRRGCKSLRERIEKNRGERDGREQKGKAIYRRRPGNKTDQSIRRLKSMAAVRAQTMQTRINRKMRGEGWPFAATTNEPNANGNAKMVCEKRIRRRKRLAAFAPAPGCSTC